jgi:DNA-binding CsgD family transcriptional regulator
MRRPFTCAQYEQMLDVATALLDTASPGSQMTQVLERLSTALGAAGGILTEGIPRVWQRIIAGSPDVLAQLPMNDLNRSLPPHPLMMHYATTGDLAVLSSDDVAGPGWHRTPTYTVIRDLLGISPRRYMRQLSVPLHAPLATARGFVVYRVGGDFTDSERAFAQRLQPMLDRVDRHLQILHRHGRGRPELTTSDAAAAVGVTPRELTVLILLDEGLTAAAIGHRLGVTVSTVNTHLERLYRKLGTNNRLTTVLLARELRLIPEARRATPTRPVAGAR